MIQYIDVKVNSNSNHLWNLLSQVRDDRNFPPDISLYSPKLRQIIFAKSLKQTKNDRVSAKSVIFFESRLTGCVICVTITVVNSDDIRRHNKGGHEKWGKSMLVIRSL